MQSSFREYTSAPSEAPDFEPSDPKETVDSVASALETAALQYPEQLIVLDSARKASQASPFQQPARVFEALQALAEVTVQWQNAATAGGGMGLTWRQAMKTKGFDWKDKISMTSRGKYGDDYRFLYRGDRVLFEEHVTLGAKDPNNCLSVHVIRDEALRKLVVGYVGRHLTNTTT